VGGKKTEKRRERGVVFILFTFLVDLSTKILNIYLKALTDDIPWAQCYETI
jgi:hypothetical protein